MPGYTMGFRSNCDFAEHDRLAWVAEGTHQLYRVCVNVSLESPYGWGDDAAFVEPIR